MFEESEGRWNVVCLLKQAFYLFIVSLLNNRKSWSSTQDAGTCCGSCLLRSGRRPRRPRRWRSRHRKTMASTQPKRDRRGNKPQVPGRYCALIVSLFAFSFLNSKERIVKVNTDSAATLLWMITCPQICRARFPIQAESCLPVEGPGRPQPAGTHCEETPIHPMAWQHHCLSGCWCWTTSWPRLPLCDWHKAKKTVI